MSESGVALGSERLPWLSDDPAPKAAQRRSELLPWSACVALLLAGAALWIGSDRDPARSVDDSAPTLRAPVPVPREAAPPPPVAQVPLAPAPQVEPAAAPPVRQLPERRAPASRAQQALPDPPKTEDAIRAVEGQPSSATPVQAAASSKSMTAPPVSLPRPAPAVRVASPAPLAAGGRLVQIGAFGTRLQAKRGWAYMARAYPGVRQLRAVVVETRNSRGRRFYRFQIATTSQAHSEVLCQRMNRIKLSCAVVGLPWKPRGVER